MSRDIKEIQSTLNGMDYISEKLGEVIYDFIMADDNLTTDIGGYVMKVINDCKTQRDVEVANNMLTAITGYGIETVIDKIKERDQEGYTWLSLP